MYSLRRTICRVLPAKISYSIPRSQPHAFIGSITARNQIHRTFAPFQRRFVSGDSVEEAAPSEATVTDETIPETPQDSPAAQYGEQVPNVLYVGNLFFDVTKQQLQRVFERFGAIELTRIMVNAKGLSRGFGYVVFQNPEDAQKAQEALNQQVFEGRRMIVLIHRPRRKEPAKDFVNPNEPREPTRTLFIGNMSFDVSDKDLNDLFRNIPNVLDVRVAIDRQTGRPRGFAHADFVDVESAVEAKKILGEKALYGRMLRVDFSNTANTENRRARDTVHDPGTPST